MPTEAVNSIETQKEIEKLKSKFEHHGYFLEFSTVTKIYLALHYRGKGLSTVLLEGPAGAGKTSMVETLAAIVKAELELYSAVATTSEEALVFDIDIAATVTRDSENINKKGKLVKAIERSEQGYSFLFLDEWDKTRPEMDSFLLDFLQSGRLTGTPLGDLQVKDFKNLIVFIAKNRERDLSEPLMRRCRSIPLSLPSPTLVRSVLKAQSDEQKFCNFMANWIVKVYSGQYKIQNKFRKVATIQEMTNALLDDLLLFDFPLEDRKENVLTWMAQYPDDKELTLDLALKIPFYYPEKFYTELRVPKNSFVDISKIVMQMSTEIPHELIKRKTKFVIWAAMWYQAQYDNIGLTKFMTFNEVLNGVKADNAAWTLEDRMRRFFSYYIGSVDITNLASIVPDFVDEKNKKNEITLALLQKALKKQ